MSLKNDDGLHTRDGLAGQLWKVEANGIRRCLSPSLANRGRFWLFLAYSNLNMDGWDPDVTISLAADHELILFE